MTIIVLETQSREDTRPRRASRRQRRERSDALVFIVVALLVFATRLPFLGPGYGADADSWRIALSGRSIATTGVYQASRLPGYPLVEFAAAAVSPFGPVALDGLTALVGALGVACFAVALRRMRARAVWAAVLALAFVPVFYINSTASMDYVWALAFAMAALMALTLGRASMAGASLGAAVACRLTSGALFLPLAIMARDHEEAADHPRDLATMAVTAAGTALVFFLPVFVRYGTGFLTFVDASVPWPTALERATTGTWGLVGTLGIGLAVASAAVLRLARRRARLEPALAPVPRAWVVAWLTAIALYLIAFLRLPLEAGYLLPLVPFAILLMATVLDRRVFVVACVAIAVSSFVGVEGGRIVQGPLFKERSARTARVDLAARAIEAGRSLEGTSVVLSGSTLPVIDFMREGRRIGRTVFAYRASPDRLDEYKRLGLAVYYLPGVNELSHEWYGIDLRAYGAKPLLPGTPD